MGKVVLVLGESGHGKSTAIESLDPKETFLINVIDKDLPFKGWASKYTEVTKANPEGNMLSSRNYTAILKTLRAVQSRENLRTIVIDDSTYTMAGEFMDNATVKGYEKFTMMASNVFQMFSCAKSLRKDLVIIIVGHLEINVDIKGMKKVKMKTIGKMLDEKVNLEGMCTMVLYADVAFGDDGPEYGFLTQTDGSNTCKSPKGMFDKLKIPNEFQLVIDAIKEYDVA